MDRGYVFSLIKAYLKKVCEIVYSNGRASFKKIYSSLPWQQLIST